MGGLRTGLGAATPGIWRASGVKKNSQKIFLCHTALRNVGGGRVDASALERVRRRNGEYGVCTELAESGADALKSGFTCVEIKSYRGLCGIEILSVGFSGW